MVGNVKSASTEEVGTLQVGSRNEADEACLREWEENDLFALEVGIIL